MDISGAEYMKASLLSYVHSIRNEATKPPEPQREYKIPMSAVLDVLRSFASDGSKSALDHLQLIEDRCTLFKLAGISEEEVKRKLLYLSLTGEARIWFKSLKEEYRLDWEFVKKAFYLKYYSPIKAYGDRCHIYNFLPHPGESITQAWGRLKERLRKNPSHGLSKSIILINFYVGAPSFQKDFLDNSSGGSFTHKSAEEAWALLDLISENTGNWDLDKGNVAYLDYGYECVKNFYTSPAFEELSNLYGLDSHVLVEVVKSFAKHISVPKEGFIEYVKPMKYPAIMPAPVKKVKPVLSIKANDYVETPPYPTRV
jgi:hypothetical protein